MKKLFFPSKINVPDNIISLSGKQGSREASISAGSGLKKVDNKNTTCQ